MASGSFAILIFLFMVPLFVPFVSLMMEVPDLGRRWHLVMMVPFFVVYIIGLYTISDWAVSKVDARINYNKEQINK